MEPIASVSQPLECRCCGVIVQLNLIEGQVALPKPELLGAVSGG